MASNVIKGIRKPGFQKKNYTRRFDSELTLYFPKMTYKMSQSPKVANGLVLLSVCNSRAVLFCPSFLVLPFSLEPLTPYYGQHEAWLLC